MNISDETITTGIPEKKKIHFSRLFWQDPNSRFLALTILVGCLGAGGAIVFRAATRYLTILLMRDSDVVAGASSLPFPLRVAIPLVGGFLGGMIARLFVRGGGTMGIAQIMEVVAVGRRTIRFRRSLARSLSSLVVISTGGSEGREGPIVQMGAAFASLLARTLKVSPERARVLVACGMAAGVAGAYNAPVAGTLFVVELVLGSFTMSVFGPAVISAFVSALLTRAVLGNEPLYKVTEVGIDSLYQVVPCIPLALLAGLASVLFMRSLRKAKNLFQRLGWQDEWRMGLAGLGVGIIGLHYPFVWGNGFEGTNHLFTMQPLLSIFIGAFIFKILATSLTIGSGGVGGVFTPALMTGAALGGTVAISLGKIFPHLVFPVSGYALLGMGGLLAGTTRAPFLAIIMMTELTQKQGIILPMMLVSILAIYGAKLFERESVYVEELRESGVEWKETPETIALANIPVKEILRKDVNLIPSTVRLPEIIKIFLQTRESFVFVGDADRRLLGVIDLHDLKEFIANPEEMDVDSGLIIAADLVRDTLFVTPEESLASANEKLWLRGLVVLPVVESEKDKKFKGVITQRDIMGAFDREILRNSKLFARIKHDLHSGTEFRYFELPEQHQLTQIDISRDMIGKTIAEIDFRKKYGITVLAVRRVSDDGVERSFVPTPREPLQPNDRLVILVTSDELEKFRNKNR